MSALTQEAGAQLIDTLNSLSPKDRCNEFLIHSLKREAEKLKKNNPAKGYYALGILGALQKNYLEMNSNHLAAISLDKHNSVYRKNYAVSLHKLGYFPDAFKYAKDAHEIAPSNPDYLDFYMSTALATGRFYLALDLIKKWTDLTGKKNILKDFFEESIKILENSKVSEASLAEAFNLVSTCLQKKNIFISSIDYFTHGSFFGIEFTIDISLPDLIDLEDEIDESLSNYSPEILEILSLDLIQENDEISGLINTMEKSLTEKDITKADEEQLNLIADLLEIDPSK